MATTTQGGKPAGCSYAIMKCSHSLKNRIASYVVETYRTPLVGSFSEMVIFQVVADETETFLHSIRDDVVLRRHIRKLLMCDHITSNWSDVINWTELVGDSKVFRMHTTSVALQERLIKELPEEVCLHPKTNNRILFVAEVGTSFYYGHVAADLDFNTYEPVVRAKEEKHLSRAWFKLREAVLLADIPIERSWSVLDVGAAPGGWTEYLADVAGKVVAVDPAEMAPALQTHTHVTHLRMKLEQAIPVLQQQQQQQQQEDASGGAVPAAAAAAAGVVGGGGGFDMCVVDMNVHPHAAAGMLRQVAPLLREGAWVVFTAKLVHRGQAAANRILSMLPALLCGGGVGGGGGATISASNGDRSSSSSKSAGTEAATATAAAAAAVVAEQEEEEEGEGEGGGGGEVEERGGDSCIVGGTGTVPPPPPPPPPPSPTAHF